jgi:hypothetical protein
MQERQSKSMILSPYREETVMRSRNAARIVACLVLGICAWIPATAQKVIDAGASAVAPVVPSRVVERVDDARLVKLTGNTHPMARPEYDKGLLETGKLLERMVLVLQRSPEQEQALAAFNERQYDPKSPDYHHWLHAEEFGQLYGPSDADMATVTSWLQNHGFEIYNVSKGRVTIEFTGTVEQVQSAFHVEMHRYMVNGEAHIANDRDPSIPEALTPVVAGVASLHDFFHKPQSVFGNYVKKDLATGKMTNLGRAHVADSAARIEGALRSNVPAAGRNSVVPQLTYTPSGDTYPHEDMTPYDFATVYNILPSWNNKILGTNVKIAISGVSDIAASDVTAFRKSFGLSGFTGTFTTKVNGTDPGADGGGGQGENTLDVEMAGATAPNADVILVVSANTATTGGDELSDSYIIDNEVAPIMSASYGQCELVLGQTGNAAINAIWQQGATAGISIFESSGDQGSAGCSDSDQAGPNADETGLQVNGIASSPYLTAVGGTDFTWSFVTGGPAKYWATSNGAQLQNALGYMPEVPWNGTCANPEVYPLFTNGFTSPEQLCNGLIGTDFEGLIKITGGSGGVSHCTTGGTTNANCTGGYPKPSWQTGLGVPNDNHRDLPDVSLFASDGFPDGLVGSAILDCEASSGSPEKTCDYTNPTYIVYQEIGGTSASSPLMAGIMALVIQKTGASQGLANPVLYSLYGKQVAAGTACDSSTVTNSSTCVFNDISSGTIAQVCITGDSDCVTNTSGDQLGILSGYVATKGYDQAIGLGSVNVANLVNAWPTTSTAPVVTLSPTSLTFASTTVGSTTAAQVVTVKNSGTAALTLTSETITGTNASSFIKSATTCGTSLAVGASCTVSVEFKPAVSGALTASLAVADNAAGSPQTVTLSGTGAVTTAPAVTLSPTSLTFASTTVGSTTAAEVVTVKNSGTAALTLTSETITGTNAISFIKSATTCGATLAASASCTVSIEFKPAAAGSLTASLSVADNATGSPQTIALKGTATAAPLTVTLSPTALTFASTVVGATTAAQVVTVKNTGTTAVTLTSETFTGTNATSFVKSATTCTTSLAGGASCTVSIEFKPTVAGALAASLSVVDNATGSPQIVVLKGTATAAPITVTLSPTSLTFASTTVGATTAAQVVTIKNTGTTAVTLTSETLTGTNATSFVKSATTCTASLAAGASCTVSIEFKPTVAGALTASLSVADNATGTPQVITLKGTAIAAPLTVTLAPTSLTFASTTVGLTTAAQVVTIKNTGTTAVTLTSETFTGTNATSFVKSATTCATSLAAAASCTISVEFKPTVAGTVTANLSVADNATGSPQVVALKGTATAAATPTVTLSPTSLAFPASITGTTSDAQVVTVKNAGTVSVTLSSIAVGGTNATSFLELNSCGTSLAAGASCSLYVAFKPAAAGALTGTISVTDTATGSPQKVTLTGTGTAAPSVKLSVTSLAFPTTKSGTTSAASAVTLTNGGTATLTLTSIALTGTNPTSFEALNTCGATLAPAASCTVYVAFKPATTGVLKGTLSVADNGAASPQAVALTGTGD